MSILFILKDELDRRLYWIQMRQEALRFISGYRKNNIIDISFPEVYELHLLRLHSLNLQTRIASNYVWWQFYFPCGLFFSNCFFFWSWIQFFFKGNSSCNEKLLYYNVRNWIITWLVNLSNLSNSIARACLIFLLCTLMTSGNKSLEKKTFLSRCNSRS